MSLMEVALLFSPLLHSQLVLQDSVWNPRMEVGPVYLINRRTPSKELKHNIGEEDCLKDNRMNWMATRDDN